MNLQQVLTRFAAMSDNDKAHVMACLLDFTQQNRESFQKAYGTIGIQLIDSLTEPTPEEVESCYDKYVDGWVG